MNELSFDHPFRSENSAGDRSATDGLITEQSVGGNSRAVVPTIGGEPQNVEPIVAEGTGCPPPLQWQEVLQEVHSRATHWTVEVPGTLLSGVTLGSGPTLLILPALAEPKECQYLLAWLLRDEFRCVLPDWRGLRSKNNLKPITLERLVDDLIAIIDHWPGEPNRVFASGIGGMVALQAAHARPQQFQQLALLTTYPFRKLTLSERVIRQLGEFWPFSTRTVPLYRAILRQNHRQWFPPFDETRFDFFQDICGSLPTRPLAHIARVFQQATVAQLLSCITQPTLVIQTEAENDFYRAANRHLVSAIPNARLEDLHNTGLVPSLTHPHRVAKLLREFFAVPVALPSN